MSQGMAPSSQPGLRVATATGKDTASAVQTTRSPAYTQPARAAVQNSPDTTDPASPRAAPPTRKTTVGHEPHRRRNVKLNTCGRSHKVPSVKYQSESIGSSSCSTFHLV